MKRLIILSSFVLESILSQPNMLMLEMKETKFSINKSTRKIKTIKMIRKSMNSLNYSYYFSKYELFKTLRLQ